MAKITAPTAEFLISCPDLSHAPKRPLPEIAFVGRSNVGKSSLINSLLSRKKLALTSNTPGKTRLINYFLIGGNLCYFVDLPGYGFARVSGAMKSQWSQSLEEYLGKAERLLMVVQLIDMRHGPTPLDEQMIDALHIYHRPWLAVLTKADKLSTTERNAALRQQKKALADRGATAVIPYSSLNHDGRDELWTALLSSLD